MDAKYFHPQAIPGNLAPIIVQEGAWLEMVKITYHLKDDSTYPSSGDSCSTKWLAFRAFLKSGGDSDYLFDLTFDLEDSTPAAASTITLTGKVRNMSKRYVAGKHTNHIEGEFEFWLGEDP